MNVLPAYFITFTTYGTWLPGDARGWRKWKRGDQTPQPKLEEWCRKRLKGTPLYLTPDQRKTVEEVCRKHAEIRGWVLYAVNARSNHVHLVVAADEVPEKVRDQFKANATGALRKGTDIVSNERVWTKGGDIEIVETEDDLELVVLYVLEAQDRMDREK